MTQKQEIEMIFLLLLASKVASHKLDSTLYAGCRLASLSLPCRLQWRASTSSAPTAPPTARPPPRASASPPPSAVSVGTERLSRASRNGGVHLEGGGDSRGVWGGGGGGRGGGGKNTGGGGGAGGGGGGGGGSRSVLRKNTGERSREAKRGAHFLSQKVETAATV